MQRRVVVVVVVVGVGGGWEGEKFKVSTVYVRAIRTDGNARLRGPAVSIISARVKPSAERLQTHVASPIRRTAGEKKSRAQPEHARRLFQQKPRDTRSSLCAPIKESGGCV
ncbi:hypothetical protein EYF80_019538 [Liparis tanakae]|uniref:Uncharacterized protein n=1 Tax=Liparis tanakae TaxID=230148 RepID=A0A4Z2HZ99_9TELE|nr:hypothetical protein EYF80_019538 [Liparis tanakae]